MAAARAFTIRNSLPYGHITALTDVFWNNEPKVNALWNGLFADFFDATAVPCYIVAPESRSGDSRKRADLGVLYWAGAKDFQWSLSFEGKAKNGDSWDDLTGQLQKWFASGDFTGNNMCWGIGAKGKEFQFYLWPGTTTGSGLVYLNMQINSGVFRFVKAVGGSTGPSHLRYDLTDQNHFAALHLALRFIALNLDPTTVKFG